MKPLCTIPLVLAVLTLQAHAQPAAATPMRDAATHEQLARQWHKAQQQDPIRTLQATTGADPSKVNQPADLLSQSDILCFGGRATLVPKRAVLHIPALMAERLKFLPGAQIQSWTEFFAHNRGWISTLEVTRVQAEGNQALPEDVIKRLHDGANLVVATYQGGPISVLPLKMPAPEAATAAANLTEKNKP